VTEAVQSGVAATLGLDLGLFVAQLVNFALVLLILWRLAWKPLLSVMESRRQEIARGLEHAEQAKAELAAANAERDNLVKEARREARIVIDASKVDAERERVEAAAALKAELDGQLTESRSVLERERNAMLTSVKSEIADLVVAATEKVSGQTVQGKTQEQLVRDAIAEIEA
jgi:F-type H+-transporting ATPase subunit b